MTGPQQHALDVLDVLELRRRTGTALAAPWGPRVLRALLVALLSPR